MDIKTFDQWLDTLSTALSAGQQAGLSQAQIENSAKMLGDYLYSNVVPDAPENEVIKALWENGSEQERQSLANMMVKMVESHQQ
ncbi:MAG: DUF3243 family protein [Syntrophaceticus sp.]|jgi:hypothetical protein|nr:DUF3243 family protein [Syntrophaceticus sp.]HBG22400.1 DUF3243 domain-containing protein [Peptococcaceae bacterium]MDD3315517.1 DUF3243 family protein [Syntrophaceticus sp.]MDD4360044.1 DUF3243 family protein [Syntrophaceticus sp.]MDD4783130.1 DUF3243 family protein [Syntrophaceticus sp.]